MIKFNLLPMVTLFTATLVSSAPVYAEIVLTDIYPEKYGFIQIGTPVNSDDNTMFYDSPAFNMSNLMAKQLVRETAATTDFKALSGSGSSNASQAAWGLAIDTNVGFNVGFTKGDMNLHFSTAQNQCSSSGGQYIVGTGGQRSSYTMIENATEDQLFQCSQEDFQNRINKIRTAYWSADKLRALQEFREKYGTHCVTHVDLAGSGTVVGKATFSSKFSEAKYNAGGNVRISSVCYSVGIAAEFASQFQDKSIQGQFETKSFGCPANCDPSKWAQSIAANFSNMQLSSLPGKTQEFIAAFNAPVAKAPPVEFVKAEPKKSHFENMKASTTEETIEKLRMQEFEAEYKKAHNNRSPKSSDYQNYLASLKKAAATVAKNATNNVPPAP